MKRYYRVVLSVIFLLSPAGEGISGNLTAVIPAESELSAFKIVQEVDSYHKETLWDYMNGGAPGYLAYGFKEVATFRVKPLTDHLEIAVAIFDMGSSLNAFGIFSVERVPEAQTLTYGIDSYYHDNALFFWQDTYYVKLMASELVSEIPRSLSRMAAIISRKIPQSGAIPAIFAVFPTAGRIRKSERYIKKDVLGQAYFSEGYSVEYNNDNERYKIFLIQDNSPRDATQKFNTYRTSIIKDSKVADEGIHPGDQRFAGTHSFYGNVYFALRGSTIVGIVGCDDQARSKNIVTRMFSRLEAGE